MPEEIARAQERILLAKFVLDLAEMVHVHYHNVDDRFGRHADLILVAAAVLERYRDGEPPSILRISNRIRMPRVTLKRKLDELKELGVITLNHRGRPTVNAGVLNTHEIMANFDEIMRRVQNLAAALSNLGSTHTD